MSVVMYCLDLKFLKNTGSTLPLTDTYSRILNFSVSVLI